MDVTQLIELAKVFDTPPARGNSHSLEIGTCYLIRTVTMHYTGRLESITETDLVLADAAWVADTGRYSEALKTGELNEVEPYPDRVIVSRGAIVDCAVWEHELPRDVK